jgi:predicted transcriptional regulator
MHCNCNAQEPVMKTSTIPSIRVKPELRQAAEKVLKNGETLSSFIEQSLQANIEKRQAQEAFLKRGLVARDEAQQSGQYFPADEVMAELETMLELAENPNHR